MKKLMSVLLGLSLVIGTASLAFAWQGDDKKDDGGGKKKKKKKTGDRTVIHTDATVR